MELITYAGGETEKSGGVIQVFRTRPQVCPGDTTDTWAGTGDAVPSRTFSLASMRQGIEGSNPEICRDVILVQKHRRYMLRVRSFVPVSSVFPKAGYR